MQDMNEYDAFLETENKKKPQKETFEKSLQRKPHWMAENDRTFNAGVLAEESRRQSVIFHALAKSDAYGIAAENGDIHPRPGDAMQTLAIALENDPATREQLERMESQSLPKDQKFQMIHQSLIGAAQRDGITQQELLKRYEPELNQQGSVLAAYRSDRDMYQQHFEGEYARAGKVNPYQQRTQQPEEEAFHVGSSPRRAAIAELEQDPFGQEVNLEWSPVQPMRTPQSDFWRHTEPLEHRTVYQDGDKLTVNADARDEYGSKLSESDKIRQLIIASELRYGSGNYEFNGSDKFVQQAQDILAREGDQLREQALQQAEKAEQQFAQQHGQLYEQMQNYQADMDIAPSSPVEHELQNLQREADDIRNDEKYEKEAAPLVPDMSEQERAAAIADDLQYSEFGQQNQVNQDTGVAGDGTQGGKEDQTVKNAEQKMEETKAYDAERDAIGEAVADETQAAMNVSDRTVKESSHEHGHQGEKTKKKEKEHVASM